MADEISAINHVRSAQRESTEAAGFVRTEHYVSTRRRKNERPRDEMHEYR